MTSPLEYPPEIDPWTADGLVSGSIPWIDVPEGYEGISSLISAVRRGIGPMESGWGSPTVAAMALRISKIQGVPTPSRKHRLVARVPYTAAALAAVAMLSSGAAVAAAGELPSPMQVAVSKVASIIGVSVPASDAPTTPERPTNHAASNPPATGPIAPPTGRAGPAGSAAPSVASQMPDQTRPGQLAQITDPAIVGRIIFRLPGASPSTADTTSTTLTAASGSSGKQQNHGSPPGSNSERGHGPGAPGGHPSGG